MLEGRRTGGSDIMEEVFNDGVEGADGEDDDIEEEEDNSGDGGSCTKDKLSFHIMFFTNPIGVNGFRFFPKLSNRHTTQEKET